MDNNFLIDELVLFRPFNDLSKQSQSRLSSAEFVTNAIKCRTSNFTFKSISGSEALAIPNNNKRRPNNVGRVLSEIERGVALTT
ncbi:hypothetical protein OUZ56_028154 [Daphnia magna]|uniref:Uncharacterized protein n=1 Tax=Daphnia magna TaxID=35525 RepID=A0ABR0B307_9CRUS|nr:hypothetical protein OUZ56_028154 [Daphnia magna]